MHGRIGMSDPMNKLFHSLMFVTHAINGREL